MTPTLTLAPTLTRPLTLTPTSIQMNANSSRSHTIVQFTISSTRPTTVQHPQGRGQSSNPDRTTLEGKNASNDDTIGDDYDGNHRGTIHGENSGSGSSNRVGRGRGVPNEEDFVTTRAKLSLVDLAGSEKGGGGGGVRGGAVERERSRTNSGLSTCSPAGGHVQEKERSRINSSLSTLSNCISCLGDARRTHVPFRDNPLTR